MFDTNTLKFISLCSVCCSYSSQLPRQESELEENYEMLELEELEKLTVLVLPEELFGPGDYNILVLQRGIYTQNMFIKISP